MKSLSVTIQMKATEQYFPVMLFIKLYHGTVVVKKQLWPFKSQYQDVYSPYCSQYCSQSNIIYGRVAKISIYFIFVNFVAHLLHSHNLNIILIR